MPIEFRILHENSSGVRAGELITPHSKILTPMFMPVGTAGALKAMTTDQLLEIGAPIMLSNAYHLSLKPGSRIIEKLGGLHRFMNWPKSLLTDSGGYQVYSLPHKKISDEGVIFKNQTTGEEIHFTPEYSIQTQNEIGADIIMAFDQCDSFPVDYQTAKHSLKRTLSWAERSLKAHKNPKQALFGISQGSIYKDLREIGIKNLSQMDFQGYALGGLSVGEGREKMKEVLELCKDLLPKEKPRYVMGIGMPEDIFLAVENGIDLFDCIIPTKYARAGVLFTYGGRVKIKSPKYKTDKYPIDTQLYSYTAKNYSRAYLHHLFQANEILGATLASIHNVHFFIHLVQNIRQSILDGKFEEYKTNFFRFYSKTDSKVEILGKED